MENEEEKIETPAEPESKVVCANCNDSGKFCIECSDRTVV